MSILKMVLVQIADGLHDSKAGHANLKIKERKGELRSEQDTNIQFEK